MGMYDERACVRQLDIPAGRRILVISDIHGNLKYLEALLEKAGFCAEDELIIDGDFLAKGEQSLEVLHLLMRLTEQGNTHVIMGNCDDWGAIFTEKTQWMDHIMHYVNYRKSGLLWDMMLEQGDKPDEITDFSQYRWKLKERYSAEFEFLKKLPQALYTDKFVFAHAAVCPDKALEEHLVRDFVRCDRFMDLGFCFDRWVIVGHTPVMLYLEDKVCANPIIDRDRKIISIDGACVLKDDGQLNCLIIPDRDSEDFGFVSYDHFPARRVKTAQKGSRSSYYIRWNDSRVRVLSRGEEFSRCRHIRTGYEMDILTKYLFTQDDETDCNDCTDYILPLEAGDEVSVVETTSWGYFVKHKGTSGWYFGELEAE